jgi:hypothetical protein
MREEGRWPPWLYKSYLNFNEKIGLLNLGWAVLVYCYWIARSRVFSSSFTAASSWVICEAIFVLESLLLWCPVFYSIGQFWFFLLSPSPPVWVLLSPSIFTTHIWFFFCNILLVRCQFSLRQGFSCFQRAQCSTSCFVPAASVSLASPGWTLSLLHWLVRLVVSCWLVRQFRIPALRQSSRPGACVPLGIFISCSLFVCSASGFWCRYSTLGGLLIVSCLWSAGEA